MFFEKPWNQGWWGSKDFFRVKINLEFEIFFSSFESQVLFVHQARVLPGHPRRWPQTPSDPTAWGPVPQARPYTDHPTPNGADQLTSRRTQLPRGQV